MTVPVSQRRIPPVSTTAFMMASGVTYSAGSIPGETSNGGTAVTFDGSAGRAIVPYSPALNPNGPFTVDFWAK